MKNKFYTFREDLKKRLKDPEFKKLWNDSEVEYQLARKLIAERVKQKISQRALAKKVKTTQAVISKVERMIANPSLNLLKRLASALDCRLELHLVSK